MGASVSTSSEGATITVTSAAVAQQKPNINNGRDKLIAATNPQPSKPGIQKNKEECNSQQNQITTSSQQGDESAIVNYLERLNISSEPNAVKSKKQIPDTPITNLNSLLSHIYPRHIKLDEEEFARNYRVFDAIFIPLNKKMKEVDPYYKKYQSMIKFAGSHYDNLLLKKPNDFDVDIVIALPLDMKINLCNPDHSDVVIQPINPGFVQLKMGPQFQNLHMRDGAEWLINKAAYKWKDESNYLLQSKFLDWFRSVVNKALNTLPTKQGLSVYTVEGVEYVIKRSQAGPAMTLIIEHAPSNFKLSVDLVPTIKFPEERWPISKAYQPIPANCKQEIWMVVGKPNKAAASIQDEQRSWRIALHYQERNLMHDTANLRQVIRLIKQLRDALGMKKIASYYIKTLFFWEIKKRDDKMFWRKDPATLFKIMVIEFHKALVSQNIPYFWNKSNNLIGHVGDNILKGYVAKLAPLLQILEQPANYKLVAKYLLSPQEFKQYNELYLRI